MAVAVFVMPRPTESSNAAAASPVIARRLIELLIKVLTSWCRARRNTGALLASGLTDDGRELLDKELGQQFSCQLVTGTCRST